MKEKKHKGKMQLIEHLVHPLNQAEIFHSWSSVKWMRKKVLGSSIFDVNVLKTHFQRKINSVIDYSYLELQ